MKYPDMLIAQIMDIGLTKDVGELESLFSKQELSKIIKESEIGQFKPESWSFWHHRLNLIRPTDPVPPMPLRPCGKDEFIPYEFNEQWKF
ncbi:MAG: hypothetical protein LBJ61_03690 [Deltaproteobacteria bacterium]|nr:hypothetical protein [Deltaproteobacteria bacterium]